MKLSDKIAQRDARSLFYTFEFFPPKTDQGFENLVARIARMIALHPLAVSVTWGAGGTTKDRTLDLAGLTQIEYGADTILHLTCTNMVQGTVDEALREAKERGIENILALRGDPPRGAEHWIPTDSRFQHGVDLVRYIKSTPEFADFCVGVAAYPDGHPDRETDEDGELEHLKEKVDAGADFIITQLFYDVDVFLQWIQKVRAKGITVPIIPGIMPIQTYASFLRMTKLCGTRVPPKMMHDLVPIRHDDQKVKEYGVKLAVDMIRQLQAGGIQGVHFCTLNLEKSVIRVLETLGLAGNVSQATNKLIADVATLPERTMTPHAAADRATKELTSVPAPESDAGKGEINNAADWDDFPNGRFGDFKSPAYGETDRWGSSAFQSKATTAPVSHWGNPKTVDDLTSLFLRYLHSKVTTTPFSSTPLSPESLMIFPHLERLTSKGWWTVGSQPPINGAPSTDEVVGWGPRGGYVYQKCFVEFFVEQKDVERIVKKVEEEGAGWISYFAGNAKGELLTNVPEGGRNAVTWGVFPGQEIAQTTIIEKESFLSWKDEAFSIWSEWASFYPPGSQERSLLEGISNDRWLVSLIHHDFLDPSALWTFLYKGNKPLL
ncbi:MTHFR-domain-containing protein [Lentinus brumalis]|uniref:MTHFR-domain-containing protein n=1 Tax=Lentinus brumalis TaxID=2498619 RepID=A0A371DV81_9APHY|nr:MTHFR-domain-containing protein [Polyporus brumalis]